MAKTKYTIEENKIFDDFFTLKEKEEFESAFQTLYPLSVRYPDEYEIFFLLGSVLYPDSKYSKAKKYLENSIKLNPTHILSSLGLIHTYFALNKWTLGLNELKRFLSTQAKDFSEHISLLNEMKENLKNFSLDEQQIIKRLSETINTTGNTND